MATAVLEQSSRVFAARHPGSASGTASPAGVKLPDVRDFADLEGERSLPIGGTSQSKNFPTYSELAADAIGAAHKSLATLVRVLHQVGTTFTPGEVSAYTFQVVGSIVQDFFKRQNVAGLCIKDLGLEDELKEIMESALKKAITDKLCEFVPTGKLSNELTHLVNQTLTDATSKLMILKEDTNKDRAEQLPKSEVRGSGSVLGRSAPTARSGRLLRRGQVAVESNHVNESDHLALSA